MPPHAAIGIDDDLASGDARVASWATDHEAAGRVHIDLQVAVGHALRHRGHNDVFHDLLPDVGLRHLGGMLSADQHSINSLRFAVSVFHGYLAFAIRAQP